MTDKIRGLLFISLFTLFIPGLLIAQTPQELTLGIWASGNLAVGGEAWFSVRANGDGFIIVETSGDKDAFLQAYDAYRTLIGEDDDSGNNLNARLEVYAEPNRIYLFKLSYYGSDESGPYRILASFDPIPPDLERNTERFRAAPIRLGQAVPVYFRSPSESRWYSCSGAQLGNKLVFFTRGNMDTLMEVYDARGVSLGENDDAGEDTNALVSILADSTGVYYIQLTTYQGMQGRTMLYTESREPGKPDRFEPDNTVAAAKYIRVGERQERTFTDADDVDFVRLVIDKSGFYEIRAEAMSSGLDCYLELIDSNDNTIDQDDDSGDNLDAVITIRLYPGSYYIKVTTLSNDPLENNGYILKVEEIHPVG